MKTIRHHEGNGIVIIPSNKYNKGMSTLEADIIAYDFYIGTLGRYNQHAGFDAREGFTVEQKIIHNAYKNNSLIILVDENYIAKVIDFNGPYEFSSTVWSDRVFSIIKNKTDEINKIIDDYLEQNRLK